MAYKIGNEWSRVVNLVRELEQTMENVECSILVTPRRLVDIDLTSFSQLLPTAVKKTEARCINKLRLCEAFQIDAPVV